MQNMIAEQKLRTQRIIGRLIREGQERGEISEGGNYSRREEFEKPQTLSDLDQIIQQIDNAEQFEIMGWMKKVIAIQNEIIAANNEIIELQGKCISLLEVSTCKAAKKTMAPVLQMVKK